MTPDELLTNVIFCTLGPAVRLAESSSLPLKELKRLTELASYRELKSRRLTMKEITDRLSVSMAKVGLLSRQLKDHFSKAESEYEAPRRLITLLWDGPKTEAQLVQSLGEDKGEEVRKALESLTSSGFITSDGRRTTRYQLSKSRYRLFQQPWMAKLDALKHLMSSVTNVVRARFFEDDDRAFARSVSFRVRESDLPQLQQLYEKQIFPLVVELDDAATKENKEDTIELNLSVLWAPEDHESAEG